MSEWVTVKEYSDITYKKMGGIARVAFNRPEIRNAFRPQTIDQMIDAIGVIRANVKHLSNDV